MISLVAAMSKNRVIGKNGHLPWGNTMPKDKKRYEDLVAGKTILMGTKTYSEADHARDKSKIVVISRRDLELPEGVRLVHSPHKALELGETDLFVTGGGQVFSLMISHADRIYLTVIGEEFEGDAFFPEINEDEWSITGREDYKKDENNKYDYSFITYERKK